MSVGSAKIFLCIVISLTLCQYPEFVYAKSRNVTYNNLNDAIVSSYNYDITRIAGGQYAKLGTFPYVAVVHRLVGNGRIGQCGGTIISNRWVLTAGHCVIEYPRRIFVVFGIINKSGIQYDYLQGPGVSMITTEVFVHPQYKETHNDIALLKMPSDIPFSSTIRPIKLASHDESFANRNAHVIGWGKDHMGGTGTMKLKYATLPILENNKCKQYWRISNNHICTVAGIGRDACQGDSGGPLVVIENGQDLQVGIVSYGDEYCPSNVPGVFTRVSSFIGWIREIMKSY